MSKHEALNGSLIDASVERVIKEEYVSSPFIQRKFQVSYLKAQDVLKRLEQMRYIEKVKEFKPAKVLRNKYIQ